MSATELLPCPFCGSSDIKAKHGKTLMLDCQGCGVVLINYKDGVQRDVHEVWNRRTPLASHAGEQPVACYIHRDQLARLRRCHVDDSDACVRYANGFPNWVPADTRSEYIPLTLAAPGAAIAAREQEDAG